MNGSLPNTKAFVIGGIVAMGMALILWGLGFLSTDATHIYLNIYMLIFGWLLISFLIHKIPLYKIIALGILFIATMLADNYWEIPDNPVTIPVVILFWLGIAYLVLPQFFKKYKIAIFAVYGVALSFFFIFRMMPNYMEAHRWNTINIMFIPIPVFASLWLYEQWRWLSMLKADKAKAELTLLKNQIDPHFFFNTLNNLYGLAVEKSDQAPAMILKLSDIMRYIIYEGKADFVSLKNEVDYLDDYIELHKIRYQRKVDISFRKNLQHPHEIAPLLLIVPLENAFKHGVERQAEHAFINLELKTTPTTIFFSISNNYEPETPNRDGIGLTNLKKRLALIYPHQHQLEIIQTAAIFTLRLTIATHEISDRR